MCKFINLTLVIVSDMYHDNCVLLVKLEAHGSYLLAFCIKHGTVCTTCITPSN